MRKLTDLDKLECAEYVLGILKDALKKTPVVNEEFTIDAGELLCIAKDEMDRRRGQYLVVDPSWSQSLEGEEDEQAGDAEESVDTS